MTTPLTREHIEELRKHGVIWNIHTVLDSHEALRAQLEALTKKYQGLVAFYDEHNGTPCEQIRHQQQVEDLTAQVEATENTWGEERVKLNEALLQLAAMTQEREALKAVVAGKGWQTTLAFYDLKLAKAQARIKELEAQ